MVGAAAGQLVISGNMCMHFLIETNVSLIGPTSINWHVSAAADRFDALIFACLSIYRFASFELSQQWQAQGLLR